MKSLVRWCRVPLKIDKAPWRHHTFPITTLTLGSRLSVEWKGPWGQESVFRCETHSHKWGRVQRDGAQWLWSALPLWELHLCESCECSKPWLERKISTKLDPQDTTKKVLKSIYLKCPHIVHLVLICISYDQKKGWESNWEFDCQP
jgi:hypothetical protein